MYTDPITDLLTRIKNGYMARKIEVTVPYSVVKEEIVKVLHEYGFVAEYSVDSKLNHKHLVAMLNYKEDGSPKFENFKRVSKPSVRRYIKSDEIKQIMDGFGISVVSTNEGIMAGHEAKKRNLGGEMMLEIW